MDQDPKAESRRRRPIGGATGPATPSPETIGGRYRLLDSLGRGGMGEVFSAHDLVEDTVVALKRFKLDPTKAEERRRFRREFHTLARLRHPRIVEAYDYGSQGDRPYYTMEIVDGPELSDLAPMPWVSACGVLRDVASALAFLHTRGLLHRDVAPRNVRSTADGRAKLLDFGMLATMGVSGELVGTLSSIPPEMVLGLPLDGRADLFGLGALGYWLLTGRHPARVRSVDDLVRHRRRSPPPPSALAADVPTALDELVLSLLSHDPMARPASAAAVLEQLERIAGLAPRADVEAARGYLHSAALVGRKSELSLVRARLQRLPEERGGVILIEGSSGMGKTRLLREIEIEAKLHGAVVVRARPDGSDNPYGVVMQLASALISAFPDALDRPGSPEVGQLLAGSDPDDTQGWSPSDPGALDRREERLQMQVALSRWFSDLAPEHPIILAVDDIQRADEASVAVLAALGYEDRERTVTVLATLRTDDRVRPIAALDKLRAQALVLHARALTEDEVTQLLRTIFGPTEGLARLAASLHQAAGGSPMLCTELVRHLLDEGTVRYEAGLWIVPERIDPSALPDRLEHAMAAKIAGLPPSARRIAQALSVHRGELTLSECVSVLGDDSEDEAFSAVDELVRQGVVVGAADRYRMSHDGLAEAALAALDGDARRSLELRVAELLLAQGRPSGARQARIGWHLLRGGREEEGAELLARAGRRLFLATSFEDAVPPLEAALAVQPRREATPRQVAELYLMLVTAGFHSDRGAVLRHADDAIALLERLGGLHWARRLQPFVGRRLSLAVALLAAYVVYGLRGGSRTRPRPVDAVRNYARCVTYAAGVAGFSFDTEHLRRAVVRVDPLRGTGRPELTAVAGFVHNLLNFNLGRIGTLSTTTDRALEAFERSTEATEVERDMGAGGARYQRGLIAVRSGDPRSLQEIEALRGLGRRLWEVGALQLRAYYHLWRGEDGFARRYRARIELEFLRLGSLWQLAAVDDASIAQTAANVGDVLGLRRAIAALERAVEGGMRYEGHLEVARAEYHRLRGDHPQARAAIERGLQVLPPGEGLVRAWALCTDAEIWLAAGDLDRAATAAALALEHCEDPEYGQIPYRFRAARIAAMVQARRGEAQRAASRLDALLAQAKPLGNPLVIGLLHETRAWVALLDAQPRRAEEHLVEMEARLAATRNPVLLARCERLRRRVLPDDFDPIEDEEPDDMVTEVHAVNPVDPQTLAELLSTLGACEDPQERAGRALDVILANAEAPQGFLWLVIDGVLSRVAPREGEAPPPSVAARATELVAPDVAPTRASLRFVAPEDQSTWLVRLLGVNAGPKTHVVGVVALVQPADHLPQPAANLLQGIARQLADAPPR